MSATMIYSAASALGTGIVIFAIQWGAHSATLKHLQDAWRELRADVNRAHRRIDDLKG